MDLHWIDRSGRNDDGDLVKAVILVNYADNRILAEVNMPTCDIGDYVAFLYVDYPFDGERRYIDFDSAKQYCLNQVNDWYADEPTRILVDEARKRLEYEKLNIKPIGKTPVWNT